MSRVYHIYQLALFSYKTCTECGIEKPLDQFPKSPRNKDGHNGFCMDCKRDKKRKYYWSHREQERQQSHRNYVKHREQRILDRQAYYETHYEQVKEHARKYYWSHREQVLVKGKAYREEHREKIRERRKLYRAKHRAHIRQKTKSHYIANRSQRLLYARHYRESHRKENSLKQREWYLANPLKAREKSRRRDAMKLKMATKPVNYKRILEREGQYCYICRQAIQSGHKLHFDHVVPLSRGGKHSEDNIKPTHKECNLRKGSKLESELTPYDRRGIA